MRPLCLAPLLVACAPGRASPPPADLGNATPAGPPGYVLVKRGAWLRTDADPEAAGVRLHDAGPCFGGGEEEKVWPMRLVADDGEWLTVENLVDDSQHCYDLELVGLAGVRVELHVRRADLAPVTTRRVEVRYDDGTGFELAAGVVAEPDGDRYRVSVDHNTQLLDVPAAAVGTSYPQPPRRRDTEGRYAELPGGEMRLGGAPIDIMWLHADIEVAPAESVSGAYFVTYAMRCSRYRTFVVEDPEGGGTGYGTIGCGWPGRLGSADRLPVVRAGAPLTWPDGRAAGEVLEDRAIRFTEDADGRRCFRLAIDDPPAPDSLLTLCAAAADWSD